ncbi:MAG: hypothetical protein F6K19_38095 [Cyanothece sp. SIO1E1]|nr:hypothetical protein [Cyanothece sp. SIO1E1]
MHKRLQYYRDYSTNFSYDVDREVCCLDNGSLGKLYLPQCIQLERRSNYSVIAQAERFDGLSLRWSRRVMSLTFCEGLSAIYINQPKLKEYFNST